MKKALLSQEDQVSWAGDRSDREEQVHERQLSEPQ